MAHKLHQHFLNYNGDIVGEKDKILEANNRGLLYGDALFETMHCNGSEVQFFGNHFARLKDGLEKLKMEVPGYFTEHYLHKQIEYLLRKNRLFQGARARLTAFRNPGGLYTPLTNDFSYIIQTSALAEDQYILNPKGLVIGLYDEIKKPINYLSNIKSTNALLFVLAGLYKKANQLDDCIILNDKGNICESISSNIFLVINDKVVTPSVQSGCLSGTMRSTMITLANENKIPIVEKDNISIENIELADEIFLTNAISGVRWVVGYKQKRYFCNLAKTFTRLLNEKAFGIN